MDDPKTILFPALILLLCSPILVAGAIFLLIRKFSGRVLKIVASCTLFAAVLAPSFVFLGDTPLPAPILIALLNMPPNEDLVLGFVARVAPTILLWIILTCLGVAGLLRWPSSLRTPRALALCALLGPTLLTVVPVTLALIHAPDDASSSARNAIAAFTMWMATVAFGWSVLLLVQTRGVATEPPARIWAIRVWISFCALLGGLGWFVGLGIGLMTR